MKTVLGTVSILLLTASAFADEPEKSRTAGKATAPIVLGATQLDGVTAGAVREVIPEGFIQTFPLPSSPTSDGTSKTLSIVEASDTR